MGFFAFEKILQATGNTTLSMAAQLSGAVTNILLDPVFIFGYFGLPAMGVAGAAVATVIGQCVSMTVGCIVHYRLNHEVDNGLRYVRPNRKIIGEIYKVGVPAIAMQSLTSVMAYGMNLILGSVSEIYVTAFGIYYKLQNFIFMPAYGPVSYTHLRSARPSSSPPARVQWHFPRLAAGSAWAHNSHRPPDPRRPPRFPE